MQQEHDINSYAFQAQGPRRQRNYMGGIWAEGPWYFKPRPRPKVLGALGPGPLDHMNSYGIWAQAPWYFGPRPQPKVLGASESTSEQGLQTSGF